MVNFAGDLSPNLKRVVQALFTLALVGVVIAYVYRLGDVPPGLFCDETSYGYNAWSILRTARDAFGRFMPLYFQALDDWKSPLYMYTAVFTVGAFGMTPFAVRLTSVLYVLGYGVALYGCFREMHVRQVRAAFLSLAALLFPVVYVYGRTSFSEAVALPFFISLATWAFLRAVRLNRAGAWWLCGVCLATIAYVYATSRLYAPELCVAAGLALLGDGPRFRKMLLHAAPAALIASLPVAYYLVFHSEDINRRYRAFSIFANASSLGEVAERFWDGYAAHIHPRFLFVDTQDGSVLHQTGAGFLPWVCAPLLLVAAIWLIRHFRNPEARFILAGLLFGPTAVAATTGWPHVTRFFQILPFIAMACGMAVNALLDRWHRLRIPIGAVVSIALLANFIVFLRFYYSDSYYKAAYIYNYGGLHNVLQKAFANQTGALWVPPDLLTPNNRTIMEFWAKLDPKENQKGTLEALRVEPFRNEPAPNATLILTRTEGLPKGYPNAHELYREAFDGETYWRLFRVEADPSFARRPTTRN